MTKEATMARRSSSRATAGRYALVACALLLALALTTQTQGATDNPSGSLSHSGRSTLVQPDGKSLVVGHAGQDFALGRYTPNGTLDKSFSGDGKLTTDFGGRADSARAVSVRGDGKILVAGRSGHALAFARYNPNGTLD